MLELSGGHLPDPDPRYGSFPQPPMGAGHLSVAYDPCPTVAAAARAEVRRQLEGWGLSEQCDTAELLVSELVTNALVHTASRFRLTLTAAHGVLRCEVSDTDRRIPRVWETGVTEDRESGRGMFLVDALAERWGCHRDGPGKTIWFELGTCGTDGCGRRQP
jgi:anti-sigma regulatory factor (Ser/Thr protein kinase)